MTAQAPAAEAAVECVVLHCQHWLAGALPLCALTLHTRTCMLMQSYVFQMAFLSFGADVHAQVCQSPCASEALVCGKVCCGAEQKRTL